MIENHRRLIARFSCIFKGYVRHNAPEQLERGMLKKVLPTGQVLRGSCLFSTGELARRNVFAQGLAECTMCEDEVLRSMGLRLCVREGDPRVKYFDVPYLPCCAGMPGSPGALPRTVPRGIGTHLIYPHSIGFSGGQLSSDVEGSSALDFPLIHDAWLQD
jgi:hypothetical protein